MSTNSVPDQLPTILVQNPEGNIIPVELPMLKLQVGYGSQSVRFYSETLSFNIKTIAAHTEEKNILFELNDVAFATADLDANPLKISMHDSELGPSIEFIPRYGLVFPHPRFPCLTTINRTRGFVMGEFKGLWKGCEKNFEVGA